MARPISTNIITKASKAAIKEGTNNIIPSGTGTFNSAIGYGAIGTGPIGNVGVVGTKGYSQPYTITLLGRKFDLDYYLNETTKFHLAQIDFHGILFYKSLKNMNIEFNVKEITDFLDTTLKIQERDTQLENILEKIN